MTVENIAGGYRISDLSDYTNNQLLQLIKERWGYKEEQPFDIIGRLKEISTGSGGSFFVLEELHSANDGTSLLYPLDEEDVRQTFYVGSVHKSFLGLQENLWVKT